MYTVDSDYFKQSEYERSNVASRLGIDNRLPDYLLSNARATLCVLDGIRKSYGSAIYISSGYRCPALNRAVGGVPNSYHLKALAADLYAPNMESLYRACKEAPYTECLWYKGRNYIHVSFSNTKKHVAKIFD